MNDHTNQESSSYFTIPFNLIFIDGPIPYPIYVNSSSRESVEKFVKIVGEGEVLREELVEGFKKYLRVYVKESDRPKYLQSLVHHKNAADIEKVAVIKDSAIKYLDDIFSPSKEFNTQILGEAIEGCHESMKSMVGVIRDYDINNLKNLIADLSFHDFYTYDHSINVSMYTVLIFKSLKPNAKEEDLVSAGLGGLLHDLGKTKIPTDILNNTGKLSDEDFNVIKTHPELGAELFEQSSPDLPGINKEAIKRVILEHHENWDGTGYPNKLPGKDHHLFSRVCSIADFFDAITTKRSYSDVLPIEDALAVMEKTVGKKIDPEIFKFFTEKISKAVLNGKAGIELPEDFDTERAHKVLPIQKVQPKKISSDFTKPEGKPKKKAA
ncbi:HD-GYP domain-containing protein [Bacteriovorax sp. Seq25_V]|uniref:HD-GYP domain-containing protein n=1 Tax=Bacteriovorax sp. Seq25_V TaxID=1201288 RepID=UPI000389F473|nr:HD domain-containing phosphohydrolase [Bacteriovorax sp. Seq25_V]EQC46865.1 HDIG domain protein [Bacteriovorax sp. Seq25_V]